MIHFSKRLAGHETFHSFILFLILLSAASLGVEAVPALADPWLDYFYQFENFITVVFIFEMTVRILSYAPRYRNFFKESWNNFDLGLVLLSLLPGIGSLAILLRLVRLIRVLRLISVSDRLRNYVDRISTCFDEFFYTLLISLVLSYIFTISGYHLFSGLSPDHWGDLWLSARTLFYLLLLQDVKNVMEGVIVTAPFAFLYFIFFYLSFAVLLISSGVASIVQAIREK